jgi:hypothetical protein
MSNTLENFRQGLESVGGRVVVQEHFSKLDVLLFEPRALTTNEERMKPEGREYTPEGPPRP